MAALCVITTVVVPSSALTLRQRLEDDDSRRDVESARRFVAEQHRRPFGDRTCDRHALLFATRELGRESGRGARSQVLPGAAPPPALIGSNDEGRLSVRNSTNLPEPKAKSLEPVWALLAFCALAVFWTWPVAATLGSRIPHDPGNPVLNIWFLWWNAQVTPLTDAWWNAPMMWPMPGSMALSEHLLGLSLVATPLQLAGVNAIAAYNVCLLLTYALSGFFAFLLGRRLTGSTFAGVCAGLAFGFSPYRASQLAHIQVLSSQWMPLALLGLHAYVASGARRWLVVFGGAWLLQALSNGYFLLFFPVLVAAWLAWFVDWRKAPGRGLAIVTAWVIASLPLLPVLLKYHEVHQRLGLTRKVAEIREFSAIPASFLHAAPLMRFWREGPAENYEQYLFTGATVVLLALAGLALFLLRRTRPQVSAGRAPILFYVAATLLMWVLALGPGAKDTNRRRSRVPIAGCSRCRASMACASRRASRWSARCASRWRQVSPPRSCRGSWRPPAAGARSPARPSSRGSRSMG